MKKIILISTVLLLVFPIIKAQEKQSIQFINIETGLPISEANYNYGNQNGISDEKGAIYFIANSLDTLKLSHISFGKWIIPPNEIETYIQKGVYAKSPNLVNLYPVTIISVRNPQPKPDDLVNIDYQQRMEHDAAALLEQIPSLQNIQKGGNYGFDPVFRGFKYDQLNIVLDGAQSATAACPNRMDPPTSQMAPNMMDRIEVFKGPHALRYGSGFGATINFIPTQLNFNEQKSVYGRVSTGYETNGNIARGESQVGFQTNKFDVSVFGAWSQGDDYTDGGGNIVQSEFLRGSFGSQIGYKISENQKLRLSGLYNLARDSEFPALPMDLRLDDTKMLNLRHDIQFTGKALQSWNTTLFGSIVDHTMDNLLKELNPRMINASTVANTYNYGGRTEGVWQSKKGKLYAGADLRVEGASGTRVREFLMGPMKGKVAEDNVWQNGEIQKTGLFAEYHTSLKEYQFTFSGRLEYNSATTLNEAPEFNAVNPTNTIEQLNPSVSAGVNKKMGNNLKMGFWLGRAQRSGSLTERYINFFPVGRDPFEIVGNPEVAPEVNHQLDLTVEWNGKSSSLKVDLFAAYLQNMISSVIDTAIAPRLPMSPGVRRVININEAVKTGFEVVWLQSLPLELQQQVSIGYTYAQDWERNEPLPEIPPLDIRYQLIGSYINQKLQPQISLRYAANQNRVSAEYGETTTPEFAILDVKIGYRITKSLKLDAGVLNLLDTPYYEHLNRSVRGTTTPIYAPGRNITVALSLVF